MARTMPKYLSYRIRITRRVGGGAGYHAITHWEAFESQLPSALSEDSIFSGGVATASSVFSAGFAAAAAFDGDPATRWSSLTNSSTTEWLRYDLLEARPIRSFRLLLNSSPEHGPRDFAIEGSNDSGATWDTIAEFKDFVTTDAEMQGGKYGELPIAAVWGEAIVDGGAPANIVRLYNWVDGSLMHEVVPKGNGEWEVRVPTQEVLLIVAIGPSGVQPQAHGPVTPERFVDA